MVLLKEEDRDQNLETKEAAIVRQRTKDEEHRSISSLYVYISPELCKGISSNLDWNTDLGLHMRELSGSGERITERSGQSNPQG